MDDLENPIDDPNQPTVTEELLQIVEEFADYIDKFMFEIVTFLAVIDSSMGLIKDVLGMFGFGGWKMTFFPSFSFVVTIGVFLFGTNKRKGKRKAEAAQLEGLGEAMEMIEDVFEVMDDVMDEIEDVEGEAGALGLGDYSDSEDDDDDDDDGNSGRNAIGNEETNVVGKTSEENDAVGKIDAVTDENNQDISQQDVKVEAEPPKSTLQKAIRIAVIAARIASKLAKKKQQDQEEGGPEGNGGNLEGKVSGSGTESEVGGESVTGTNEPPTDDKSKQGNSTRNKSAFGGPALGEDGDELKNEASALVEAVKEDSVKAAELVKEGSLGAGTVVHGSTKQVLASTGALKVGHGLYREADFITGHLNKEGKTIAKSLEKDTREKTRLIKDNEIVRATGAEKAGTAVSREATFVAGHLNQEAKKAIPKGETAVKGNTKTSVSKVTGEKTGLRSSQQGKEGEATRLPKTRTKVHESSQKPSPVEVTRQKRETKGKTNQASVTDVSKQNLSKVKDSETNLSCETHLGDVKENCQNISKLGDKSEEKQAIEKGRKEETTETSKPQGNQELTITVVTENTSPVKGETKAKQPSESEEVQDPERLVSEPQPGVSNMASNVMEGAPGAAAGAAAASQAKQGLQQTGKKSKGLLQIAMRLVRLIMRVAKKRGNSAASSQNSSRRGSTASGAGSLGGEPAKGKRSAGGDGGAADIAGAASSMAMGKGGAKGGKIGAIVGIVVRVVRLASKLKGGGQKADPPDGDMRSSKESIESDSEFYDCGEEFPTQEIQTQTEDRLSLLSVATQTTETVPGSTLSMTSRDPGNIMNMHGDERERDMKTYVDAFKGTLGREQRFSSGGSQSEREEDAYQGSSKEILMPSHEQAIQTGNGQDKNLVGNQNREIDRESGSNNRESNRVLLSREQGTNMMDLQCDEREETTRRNSAGSLQRITLKILSPNTNATNNPDLNSVLLDIDAPVVLHSARDFRPSINNANVVANGNQAVANGNIQVVAKSNRQMDEKQTSKDHKKRKTQEDVFSKDEFSARQGDFYKCSSVDLDELEKQPPQSRTTSQPRRDSRTYGRDSSEGASDLALSRQGVIVPYSSSSSEDLDEEEPFLQRRRPTVVRFEDECEYSYLYDEDEPVASCREKKKRNILNRSKTPGRSTGLKKYSSLEDLDYRFPEDQDIKRDDDPSIVRVSGCDQESTRLLSEYEKPLIESGGMFAARKSRLSSRRTSYFGDDESDQPESLC